MEYKKLLLFFLVLIILGTDIILAVDNSISIEPVIKVTGLGVELQEIAKLEGSDEFKDKAREIKLGQAPLPGYQRVLYRDEVLYALKSKGVDISLLNINIPYQFKVISKYKKVTSKNLIDLSRRYLEDKLLSEYSKIDLELVSIPKDILIPEGKLDLIIGEVYQGNLVGRVTIPVEIVVEGKLYRREYLQFNVRVAKKALVAKQKIERGTLLKKELFDVLERYSSSVNNQFISVDDNLLGKRIKVNLNKGTILLKNMVESKPLVERWKEVFIIAKVNGVEVTTVGKALQKGSLGEIIKVQNKRSRKEIRAEIVGKNKVQVLIN